MVKGEQLDKDKEIILAGAMTLFDELFILDLRTGLYRIYKMDNMMSRVATNKDFHNFNQIYGAELVHPDDREKFFEAFRLDNIKKRVTEGEKKIAIEVRRKTETGIYHWCELTATRFDDDTDFPEMMVMTFRDINELWEARQEERFATQRFTSAVNSSYDAIYESEFYSDSIYIWKKPGKKFKKFKPEKSMEKQIGRILEVSVHPDYREEVELVLNTKNVEQEFLNGKTRLYCEAPCMGEDGKYRWFFFQLQLLEKTETTMHIMYYLKDINDAKKREKRKHDELQQALAMARKANDAKMEFLSRMSHDIRTPINTIMGMTAVVDKKKHDPGAVGEYLKKIDVSAKFLLSLIDDIMDMSKIEGGKVSIVSREMSFLKLIDDLDNLCHSLAEDKNQKFNIKIGKNVRCYYKGDSLRINQVFLNLLSNAFKYTPIGGIVSFFVDADMEADGKQWLTTVIADNGIGMSESFIERIFEPFEQEEIEKRWSAEGTGLGLTLTLSLVVMMEGTISVKSEKYKGSVFTVKFPLEVVKGEETCISKILEETAMGSRMATDNLRHMFKGEKILLVEDDELSREIVKAILEMRSLDVDIAVNGREGVDMFENSSVGTYKAILMDIRMPVMDGLEATKIIRSMCREDALTVPIIALTADSFQNEEKEAKACGMNTHMTKPMDAEEMYRHLWKLFGY